MIKDLICKRGDRGQAHMYEATELLISPSVMDDVTGGYNVKNTFVIALPLLEALHNE